MVLFCPSRVHGTQSLVSSVAVERSDSRSSGAEANAEAKKKKKGAEA